MKALQFGGAAAAAVLLSLALPACKDIPEDATYAQPEKAGVYYEEPTAAQECQDDDAGPECPDTPVGPVETPEPVK